MTEAPDIRSALTRYARFFEGMTEETLDELGAFYMDDVRFVDPFNDVRGREAVLGVFRHMYRTTQNPRFAVRRIAVDDGGGILEWVFDFSVRGRVLTIEGTSVVTLAPDERVSSHVDHWDAAGQLYAKLPLIGPVIRWITRKFRA